MFIYISQQQSLLQCGGRKTSPRGLAQCCYFYWSFGIMECTHLIFEDGIPLKLVLGGVRGVALLSTSHEQSQSNRDCCFQLSSFALFASGRSYHQNLLDFKTGYNEIRI